MVPLTEQSVAISADLYAKTRKLGTSVDDIDILIAGIALANDWGLVTHNTKHFSKIEGLNMQDWSQ